MKALVLSFLSTLVFFVYCKADKGISSGLQEEIPVVQSSSVYNVLVEKDIVYAKALSHDTVNSANATTITLKLDVYVPDNQIENRPVYLFVHGGGFTGGSKQQTQIIALANYYASRGWVFISIDYRLKNDYGTIPRKWLDFSTYVPPARVAQFLAIYPAQRDAKAALRWVMANADTYKINRNYITVGGGSAGAITAIGLGVSNQEDFRDELDTIQDPTLTTTHLEQSYQIRTIIDLWGAKVALDLLEQIFGHQRFDGNDPSLFIAHGTEDPTVPFMNAKDLKSIYETTGAPFAYFALEGKKHGAWDATVNNKSLKD